jgi:thiol-disulfide isomerase/thioredoxin
MCFHGDPKKLPMLADVDYISDTIIAGKSLYAYATTAGKPSDQSGKSTVTTKVYYLDPEQQLVDRISYISHVGRDTSQIIDYFFSDYAFSDQPFVFEAVDRGKSQAYREISTTDEEQESRSGLIHPGAQLHRADYPDLDGKEQLIYGKAGKKTVVMFGFIGCGNCEYAFREMKKKEFTVRKGVDLLYSSPVDASAAVKGYLKKKEFPFTAFSKNSRMNDNFKVAGFPTFVVIDEKGGVEQVLGTYDEKVDRILFESAGN